MSNEIKYLNFIFGILVAKMGEYIKKKKVKKTEGKMRKSCAFILMVFVFLFLGNYFILFAQDVPQSPSVVYIDGKKLKVMHRRYDGSLKAPETYVIKGVCWNPAQVWPVEAYPPGAPFENDTRERMWRMAEYDFPRIKDAGFNTIRVYMDLGIPEDNLLFFHEDTDGVIWYKDEYGNKVADDDDGDGLKDWLEGMQKIGGLSQEAYEKGKAVLDLAYKNGLKVIMVVDKYNADIDVARDIVYAFKDHPAILMWMIGNEFNYATDKDGDGVADSFMWTYDSFSDACSAANAVASAIKQIDPNHPVAVCLGEPGSCLDVESGENLGYAGFKAGLDLLTDVDCVGLNIYRGKSFKHLYKEWTDPNYVGSSKPIFISEYGVDTWHYNEDSSKEFEDLGSQKEGISWQWDDIHSHLSSINSDNILMGAFVFEWVDEFWKLKGASPFNHDTDPGYPVNIGQPPTPDLFPDGCMHEEWWGINTQDTKSFTPVHFYCDYGLIYEMKNGSSVWDIYSWGLDNDYGYMHAQADYVRADEVNWDGQVGVRATYGNCPEYHYTGVEPIPEGHRCMYTKVWGTSYGGGWGIFHTQGTIDLSQYKNGVIKFWIKIQQTDGTPLKDGGIDLSDDIYFKFEDSYGSSKSVFIWLNPEKNGGNSYITGLDLTNTAWQEVIIPVSALFDGHTYNYIDGYGWEHNDGVAKLDLTKMKMVFSITSKKIRSGEPSTEWWIDDIRWETGNGAFYNRKPKPVVADYRDKYNTLSYKKNVFDVEAVSFTGEQYCCSLKKNDSTIISDWLGNENNVGDVIAVSFDGKTGEVVNWTSFTNSTDLDNWILQYKQSGDFVLSFAVNQNCSFLGSSVELPNIGSQLYNQVGVDKPWVYIVHLVNGEIKDKKESLENEVGSNYAKIDLAFVLDMDKDGIFDYKDNDRDNDGLTDAQEIRYGTDILDADTDDDGISDFEEVNAGTNPRNADSKNLATDPPANVVVYPSALEFENQEDERYLYINNDGGKRISYKIDVAYLNGSGWLKVKCRDHTNNEEWTDAVLGSYVYDDIDDFVLKVAVDRSLISAGEVFSANLTVTAVDQNGNPSGSQVINVKVKSIPVIATDPVNKLEIIKGSDNLTTSSCKFYISNKGKGAMNWSIENQANWLTLDVDSGTTLAGESTPVTATVDWNMAGKNAQTTLKISAPGAETEYLVVHAYDREKYTLNTPLSTVDASFVGSDLGEGLGAQIACGDIDGDGYNDYVLRPEESKCKVYIVFGDGTLKNRGVTVDPDITIFVDELENVKIADINNDGFSDIILSYNQYSGSSFAYINVIYGKNRNSLQSYYTKNDYDLRIDSTSYFADLGIYDMAFGDVNGDGNTDILFNARGLVGSIAENGRAVLIFGPSSWPTGDKTLDDFNWVFFKYSTWNYGGTMAIGNFDNDSYDDILIGSFYNNGWKAFLVYGKQTFSKSTDLSVSSDATFCYFATNSNYGSITGDVNNDGCDDLILQDKLLLGSTNRWSGVIDVDENYTTDFSACEGLIVDDLNGDGVSDVVVSNHTTHSVYFGRSVWNGSYTTSEADVSYVFDKTNDSDYENVPILSSDLDNDGVNDLVISARANDEACEDAGQVYIVSSKNFILNKKELVFKLDSETTKSFYIRNVSINGNPENKGVIFKDDFESGTLNSTYWTTGGDNEWRVRVSNAYSHSGSYSLLLDDYYNGGAYSHSYAILTLNLASYSNVHLRFWWREFYDENHSGDGIFISNDGGVNWFKIFSFNGGPYSYTYEDINLTQAAQNAGISLTDNFKIKFQFYDNYSIASDGYSIDDVEVIDYDSAAYIDWTAQADVDWITSISPASGTMLPVNEGSEIVVTVDRTGLEDGIYYGNINVTSGTQTQAIPVRLVVGDYMEKDENIPILDTSKEHIVAEAGDEEVEFYIENIGSSTLDWQITENESWIESVSPNTGSTDGKQLVRVTINRTGLENETTGKLVINSNGGTKEVFITVEGTHSSVTRYSGDYNTEDISDASFVGTQDYQNVGDENTFCMRGDLNGDGFDDLVIGTKKYDGDYGYDQGRLYVIFGAANKNLTLNSNIDDVADVIYEGSSSNAGVGRAVSIGDVNGDGLSDIIVSSYGAYLYIIFGKTAGWPTTPTLIESAADAYYVEDDSATASEFEVISTGDVNNDGYDDIVTSVYFTNEGGRVYIIFGKAQGWVKGENLQNADVIYCGTENDERAGVDLSVGDANGDGFDDIVVGTIKNRAYIIFGRNTNWPEEMTSLAEADVRFDGLDGDYAGSVIATGGDVNNDNIDDVFICAGGSSKGYLVFGRNTWPSVFSLADADSVFINFYSVYDADLTGDIDCDGVDDLLLSRSSEKIMIFYGRDSWLSQYDSYYDYDAKFQNSNIWAVATGGDFNGDGADDILGGYCCENTNGYSGNGILWFIYSKP